MKLVSKILLAITALLSSANSFAQIKNAKTETVKIYGNCGMCKARIEKAGSRKNIANVTWDKETKRASLQYDLSKTNRDEILKRIALAGHDNEKYLAPDDVYAQLPECCLYKRELKVNSKSKVAMMMEKEHSNHNETEQVGRPATIKSRHLNNVIESYFLVKDALVKSDAIASMQKAAGLLKAIKAVEMTKLSAEEHTTWMRVMKDLELDAQRIAGSKDIAKQRTAFTLLSKNMYDLVKTSGQDKPIYYQHCPMYNNGKGANWLSKESAIKNPYYGAKMMTCGSTIETLD
jgi:hypothetical protein